MDGNEQVATTTPAPAAAPTPEPAPAPQADTAVEAEEQEQTVSIRDLVTPKKAEKDGSGTPKGDEQKPDAKPAPAPAPAPAAPAKDGGKPEPPITSQRDFNTALGKRMEAERQKYAPLMRLVQAARDANPGMTDDQIMAALAEQRNEKLGISQELAKFIDSRLGSAEEAPPAEEDAPLSDEDREEIATRWGEQADAIQKLDKDFDVKAFLTQHADKVPALQRGDLTITGLYYEQNFDALMKKARDDGYAAGQADAVNNIRSRNNQVPTPVSSSAPAEPSLDFTNMSTKRFNELNAEIDRQVRSGKMVRLE